VDHPLTASEALVRPWRTAALVAGAVALVELLALIVIAGGAIARTVADRVERAAENRVLAPTTSTKKAVRNPATNPAAKLPRTKTRVLVLNGNGRQGAAAVAAGRVQHRGYRIEAVANASRSDFARSIIMFRPRYAGEGHRLARDLGVKQVTPLDGMRIRQLHGAHLVFILGA
jgi:hypothetical protein